MIGDGRGPLRKVRAVVQESESSPIREMKKMMEDQPGLFTLAFGEANFDPPRDLIRYAIQAMRSGKNHYTSTHGIPQLREAIAEFARNKWGAMINPEANVLVTVGAIEALYLAANILLERGDRVMLPDPGWGLVRTLMERLGARLEFYPLVEKETYTIDPDPILDRMDERIKLIVINTPSNPTGAVLSRKGFSILLEKAREKGVFILSDETYHNYVYQGEHVSGLSFDSLENFVMVNSFSKTFAITGWRLGYAVAHPWMIKQMGIFKESVSLCSFSIGQWALAEFLSRSDDYLHHVHTLCRENMEKVVARLRAIPGVRCTPPQGGFYVFPDFSAIEPSSQRLWKRLLEKGVAVVPGDFFGSRGEGHARVGFAAPYEAISPALDRLEASLRE